jgi:hypothetical protein
MQIKSILESKDVPPTKHQFSILRSTSKCNDNRFYLEKKPILTWSSLRMMRRYLAVNRSKEKY